MEDRQFEEIPPERCCSEPWATQARLWLFGRAVHEGEARATVEAMTRGASPACARRERRLRTRDNLGMAVAMESRRAHASPLIIQIRCELRRWSSPEIGRHGGADMSSARSARMEASPRREGVPPLQ